MMKKTSLSRQGLQLIVSIALLLMGGLKIFPLSTDLDHEYGAYNQIIQPSQEMQPVSLVRVVDGDTLILKINHVEERVRLIGMDTPESVHPNQRLNSEFGDTASKFVENLLTTTKEPLTIEMDVQERDRYGRILAYVWVGDQMLNETLLTEGYAQIATYPPNTKYVDQFIDSSRGAWEHSRGFWAMDEEVFKDGMKSFSNQSQNNQSVKPSPNQDNHLEESQDEWDQTYVANTNTGVYHRTSCHQVAKIADHNQVSITNKEEALQLGYRGCNICRP